MSELSLRRVEYFVVVAAELNFGRAAERLHVTQPVLSRQIALLERELGVPLFERSSRGTSLTEAGRELLPDAQAMLQSAAALQRRGRQAARGTQRLVVGFMPGLLATPILQGLRAAFPALEVSTVRTSWDDQVETILDGRVDLGLVRLPVPTRGLTVQPLFAEHRLAVLPRTHPLADRGALDMDAVAELELLQSPDAVPEWREARLRRGLPVSVAPSYPHEVEVKLEQVALGLGVAFLPASTARFYSRPDVIAKEVTGLGPSEVGVAWAARRRSEPLTRAVELAHALRTSLTTERVLDEAPGSH
ncbi:LysR family transcriptional regulator [Nocardioides luteus]|uniref:LysR family transcriptional regulator n=1 Tax=Nocardioides luteus TaxID=1844 RepID=UPI001A19E931|nr:LysR family transcriptional regulator [Nocardioides luteus]MBG6098797.1 DNA-binding transcriptional LysR family regulator [Nocardioides luteus]